jgi:predicted MFS family arabinose efflux permease
MFGALGAHWICDRYGRRLSFIVAAVGFIIGIVIMACAWSFPVLMFGRVFVGLGVGFGLAVRMPCSTMCLRQCTLSHFIIVL